MCRVCTDPLEALVKLRVLNCNGCPDVTAIPPELVDLVELHCVDCDNLASIPATLVNLRRIICIGCDALTSLPDTLACLTELDCSSCRRLSAIPGQLTMLQELHCANCPLLAFIPSAFTRLTFLKCNNCRILASIPPPPTPDTRRYTLYHDCPWLPENASDYPDRISSLLRLQRWFRHGKKQVFKRVLRTRAFNEFVYHPDQIGGKVVKRQMEAELGAMRPEKKQ